MSTILPTDERKIDLPIYYRTLSDFHIKTLWKAAIFYVPYNPQMGYFINNYIVCLCCFISAFDFLERQGHQDCLVLWFTEGIVILLLDQYGGLG